MDNKLMLMIPGPTPVPESVLLAMAQHPIGHRSGDFGKIMAEVSEGLKWLHQTQNDVLILSASGTGAMEAGIINFLSLIYFSCAATCYLNFKYLTVYTFYCSIL